MGLLFLTFPLITEKQRHFVGLSVCEKCRQMAAKVRSFVVSLANQNKTLSDRLVSSNSLVLTDQILGDKLI
jgi:hypothetical protein